jgi:hypothetical protein
MKLRLSLVTVIVSAAAAEPKVPGEEPQLVAAAGALFRNKKQVLRAAATTTWQPRRQRDGSDVEVLVRAGRGFRCRHHRGDGSSSTARVSRRTAPTSTS